MLEFASHVPNTTLEAAKFESICEGRAMSLQDFYVDDAECRKTGGVAPALACNVVDVRDWSLDRFTFKV